MNRLLLTLLFTAMATTTQAREKVENYFGLQFGNALYSETDGLIGEPSLYLLRYGKKSSQHYMYEARYGSAGIVNQYDQSLQTASINSVAAIMGGGHYTINREVVLYGLLGYATAGIDSSTFGSKTEGGFAYSVAGQFSLGLSTTFDIEYANYINSDAFQLGAFTVGVTRRFK